MDWNKEKNERTNDDDVGVEIGGAKAPSGDLRKVDSQRGGISRVT